MANIFRYEVQIDKSNKAFIQALDHHAKTRKSFNLFHLIARYAFDTLFYVTTGQSPGFLAGLDITSLATALEEWKFNSIASGSCLRFHAAVTHVIRSFDHTTFDYQIFQYLNIIKNGSGDDSLQKLLKSIEPLSTRAACAAMIVAASDRAMTHIGAALFYIYHDLNILKKLRTEIANAKLTDTVTLKEIMQKKSKMPLLYTCLRESIRQWRQHTDRFVSSSDSVSESVVFGKSDFPNDLHMAILTKIIIQVVMRFDMIVTAPIGEFDFSSETRAVVKYRTQPATAASVNVRKEKAAVWKAFAVDTAAAYKKAVDEYVPPKVVDRAEYEIKETFRKRPSRVVVEETAGGVRGKVVPPHLRARK